MQEATVPRTHMHNMHAASGERATVISLAKYMVSTAAISFQGELDCRILQTLGDITPAASWLVVFCRCGPTGCSSNHDAPVRSHGCRMKCHRRLHSQGAGLWTLWPTRADIRENGNHPAKFGLEESWLVAGELCGVHCEARRAPYRERRENLHIL